jgi:hypothetical protein
METFAEAPRWEQRHEEWEQRQKKFDADFVKSQEAWEQRQKELDAEIAALSDINHTRSFLIETLIAERFWEKFPEYNLQRAYRRFPLYNEKNELKNEIDILLVNTEWAMAVDVIWEADANNVAYHIKRMAQILKYPPAQLLSNVKLLGAVAGGIITPEAREAAYKAGFYVLELAGESIIRLPEPPGFKPKE